jgi:hypothetical protein
MLQTASLSSESAHHSAQKNVSSDDDSMPSFSSPPSSSSFSSSSSTRPNHKNPINFSKHSRLLDENKSDSGFSNEVIFSSSDPNEMEYHTESPAVVVAVANSSNCNPSSSSSKSSFTLTSLPPTQHTNSIDLHLNRNHISANDSPSVNSSPPFVPSSIGGDALIL